MWTQVERGLWTISRGAEILHPIHNYWCKLLSLRCITEKHRVISYELYHTSINGNETCSIPVDKAARIITNVWSRQRYWELKGVEIPPNVDSYLRWANSLIDKYGVEEDYLTPNWWILPVRKLVPPIYHMTELDVILEKSNRKIMHDRLGGLVDGVLEELCIGDDIKTIVNDNHYDVFAKAIKLSASMLDYAILSDDHCSNLEHERANEIWAASYTQRDRIDYIRKHESEFDLDWRGFAELKQIVKGEWFGGYASELLGKLRY